MLISPAFAQTAAAGGGDAMAMLQQFGPLALIFVVFYMLLIRPQQKRMKEHKAKLEAIRRGDQVLTGGGIIGTVIKVEDDKVIVDLADNVRVTVLRATITDVLTKTQPVKGGKDEGDTDKAEDGKAGGLKGLLSKK
ncbi:preprotein translocase subunit YajC [Insolitispirillum peregrinum]|uniref:preprotein translocase subunit YajC n=1 Tax=Insolitispirillum peregrinum TaxID=80876 RepID=UPI00360E2D17